MRRYYLQIGYGQRQRSLGLGSLLWKGLTTVAAVALLVLLLPALWFIFLLVLAVIAGAAISAWIWWLVRGRGEFRRMSERMQQAGQAPAPRPRKRVQVHVRKAEEPEE